MGPKMYDVKCIECNEVIGYTASTKDEMQVISCEKAHKVRPAECKGKG